MLRKTNRMIITVFIAAILAWGTAFADKPPKIKIGSVGWTGVTIKTELAVTILESIGYDARNLTMSVPITYMALSKGDVDFFLGNWMPTMANIASKYFEKRQRDSVYGQYARRQIHAGRSLLLRGPGA